MTLQSSSSATTSARLPLAALTLSLAGLGALILDEGHLPRATDIGDGVQTIGHGTTRYPSGEAVQAGDTITPTQARVYLLHDANAFQRRMRQCLGDAVMLYPHEWDAYTRLTYNIGTAAFCQSTLAKKLKATPPDYAGACKEILRWNRVNGQIWQGLVARRQKEHAMCMGLRSLGLGEGASK